MQGCECSHTFLNLKKLHPMRLTVLLLLCVLRVTAQDFERLFMAEDFTSENIFTNNIEGPAFDHEGRLYVVNFQRDGTIGYVKANGEAQLFLELPAGSTANSIQFDS